MNVHQLYKNASTLKPRPVTSQQSKGGRAAQENARQTTMAQEAYRCQEMKGKRSQLFNGIAEKTIEDETQCSNAAPVQP
jgi:trimethylamine:corrinoid methyltransferase-like protein